MPGISGCSQSNFTGSPGAEAYLTHDAVLALRDSRLVSPRRIRAGVVKGGDLDEMEEVVGSAGLQVVGTRTRTGTARFDSVDEFVATEVEGSPLIECINDDVYERIRAGARQALAPFTTATGAVEVPTEGHITPVPGVRAA